MELSKRASIAALVAIPTALGAVVVYDVYADWRLQGEPLLLTLAENSIPLALVAGLLVGAYRLSGRLDRESLETVATWTAVGVLGIVLLGAWVFGIQLLQQKIKPFVLVSQAALAGAVGGVLVGYNIAQVRAARAESERERRRQEALFANAPTAIADLSVDGDALQVMAANEAFREWFDADDPTGAPLSSFVPLSDADLTERVECGDALTTEIAHESDDGLFYYVLRFVPYRVGDEDRAYAILTDITDLKETERELQETVADLERSNEQLEQFAYVASHDLQEPLRMVSSYVDLLAAEYGDELDDEADEYVRYAVDGAERMQAMIDGLLEYSRVQTRGEAFDEADADAVFERTRQDLELLIDDADATVTADPLPTVVADADQLGQVFQNLVKNAIDHGGDAPEIHVGAEERAEEYVFSVADDGPGIPPDQRDRMFEIFEQGDRDGEGTGMGLAICERIVARHDGEMWIESTEGEGTTVYFSLPRGGPDDGTGTATTPATGD